MKEPRSDKFDPVEMANKAIDLGIRYFDTAPAYNNGQSERNYGEVLAHRRGEVFLAGKTDQRTYDGAMRQVEASLKRLRTDRFDLLQIHNTHVDEDLAAWGKPDGAYRALEKLRQQKVTRWIGVTGHESPELMCRVINMYEFDTILTTFNPTPKRKPYIEKVLPPAHRKRMGIIAMKLFGGAFGSLAVGNPIKNDGKPNHDDAPQQADAGALVRYVLGLPVAVAVVGSGSLEELRINAEAARLEPLGEKQRRALEARMGGKPPSRQEPAPRLQRS
jgi:aryl-alcohol dehydrogenase-like predicted oxidoreductase